MTTLVLLLFLSPIFGGTVQVHATWDRPEACEQLKHTLAKATVKYEIIQDCTTTIDKPDLLPTQPDDSK